MGMHDVVIRNGTVIDGTGAPGHLADVAVTDGRITEVGRVSGTARRVIDAEGRVVTPGFVDIHSHLDAQIAWDPLCSSSCWHGVTSVVVGNCGVTFAPVRPTDHDVLARLMESVEDIPADAIMEGLDWGWESYADYYAALDGFDKGINVGGMVGHAALRLYAMGERCVEPDQHPDDAELATMVDMVDDAIAGGALGVSTSRILGHLTPDGVPIPGTFARPDELHALARPLGIRGRGVFEVIPRFETDDPASWDETRSEIEWMADITRTTGRPLTFTMFQMPHLAQQYAAALEMTRAVNDAGAQLRPQSTTRGIGFLYGDKVRSPFDRNPMWRELREIPLRDKLAAYTDPETRQRLVAAATDGGPVGSELEGYYVLRGLEPDYTPDPTRSLADEATRRGVSAAEAYMDLMVETDATAMLHRPVANLDFDALQEILTHPDVVLGLADSGAHVSQIMDASQPTWFLTHWVRNRGAFTIEDGIRRLTSDTARLFGLEGRGVLEPGAHADVNVLDLAAMRLNMPDVVTDFPGGAKRLIQRAEGYDYTLVNGQVFMEDGEHTGALPGTLLRS